MMADIPWTSLIEAEQKSAQAIREDENLGEYLKQVKVDQESLKQTIISRLKILFQND